MMLNKSFGVNDLQFNIFSEKSVKQMVLKFAFFGFFKKVFQNGPFHTAKVTL